MTGKIQISYLEIVEILILGILLRISYELLKGTKSSKTEKEVQHSKENLTKEGKRVKIKEELPPKLQRMGKKYAQRWFEAMLERR